MTTALRLQCLSNFLLPNLSSSCICLAIATPKLAPACLQNRLSQSAHARTLSLESSGLIGSIPGWRLFQLHRSAE